MRRDFCVGGRKGLLGRSLLRLRLRQLGDDGVEFCRDLVASGRQTREQRHRILQLETCREVRIFQLGHLCGQFSGRLFERGPGQRVASDVRLPAIEYSQLLLHVELGAP